ncbi:MAG TPA: hypothetical protein DFS52_01050 [Myxococcales bacterium]|nr:hypothetical protein [Myxococcales bacterium]
MRQVLEVVERLPLDAPERGGDVRGSVKSGRPDFAAGRPRDVKGESSPAARDAGSASGATFSVQAA